MQMGSCASATSRSAAGCICSLMARDSARANGETTTTSLSDPSGFGLRSEGVLTGQVLSVDGKPIAGVDVNARIADHSTGRHAHYSTFRTRSDAEGKYVIRGLPQTEFNVSVDNAKQHGVVRLARTGSC